MKIVCERRCDEGVRFFKDNVCGTIRTIDGGGDKRVIEVNEDLSPLATPPISYCIDANYYKGTTVQQYLTKKRRQLVLEKPCATQNPSYRVRKLTQLEAWRLMGFEDEDFYKAQAAMNQNLYGGNDRSGSQLYKQAGNSIVVDVLCAIMGELYQAMPYLFEDMEIGSFFSGIGAFEKALTTFDTQCCQCDDDQPPKSDELRQVGYINNYNGDANRVYDGDTVARVLKAEAGGGGAKTGWYTVEADGG